MKKVEVFRSKKNSLLYWFPLVKDLGIPVPLTKWVAFPQEITRLILSEEGDAHDKRLADERFEACLVKLRAVAKEIGYPVFLRTDSASDKHGWEKTAFVRNESELESHILETIEFNEMAGMLGLNYEAIVLREFLELDWRFKAFHGRMPVAKERRYFVKDGDVICSHPYWFEDAIQQAHNIDGTRSDFMGYFPHKLPNTWEKMLEEINYESIVELGKLRAYALLVSDAVKGYWSVDFACTRDGKWYLIDMALGFASEHYPDCPKKLEFRKKTTPLEALKKSNEENKGK